ncbi:MAG TPA: hypothetical protein VKV02_02415 [Acidobacteriaceae bacterium]|jgi:methyl-accepting chemotaxis protein|nr:hypothetical protein [Acidobacteriaceae bacterium]
MVDVEQLAAVVEELVGVLQVQARDLERLITHVEQVTTRLPESNELAVVRAELAALHVRIKKLRAG